MDLFKFAFMFLQAVNEGKNLFSVKIVVLKEKDLQTVFRSLVCSQKKWVQCLLTMSTKRGYSIDCKIQLNNYVV